MNKIKQALNDKRFRYGAYSTLMTALVIGILVVINLIMGQVNFRYDLTKEKMFTLSDQTKEIIKDLEDEVNIYALFPNGEEIINFTELLDQYKTYSNKIKVAYKDPISYPQFVSKYQKDGTAISNGSIIVESEKRFRIIDSSELLSYRTVKSNEYPYGTKIIAVSNDIEPNVTNAIQYVLQEETPMLYSMNGHGELGLDISLIEAFENTSFQYDTIDTVFEEIPDDCSILIMTTPEKDYSGEETERILSFLDNNGRAMIFIDYIPYELPNFMSILETYGLELGDYYIYEGNKDYANSRDNKGFLAQIQEHEITDSLTDNNYRPYIYFSTGLQEMKIKRDTLKITPLLTSSAQSYGKNSPEPESINKEPEDLDGPFNVAVTVEDIYSTGDESFETKIVVVSNSLILDPMIDIYYSGGINSRFIINSANWLSDQTETTYIPSKAIQSTSYFQMTQAQVINTFVITVIVVPISILLAGIIVWLRRRNK